MAADLRSPAIGSPTSALQRSPADEESESAHLPLAQHADRASLIEPPGPDLQGCHHMRSMSAISVLAVRERRH